MADYWLRRPELRTDSETLAAVDQLLAQVIERGPGRAIEYTLGLSKWEFLSHVAERANVVPHGSADPGIELFEPRQPDDTLDFSSQRAVFAGADGIRPMYYAILDRVRYPMMLCNACVRKSSEDGVLGDPYYFFSVSEKALQHRPWRSGTVYLLPTDTFDVQPLLEVGDSRLQVVQAASPVLVEPLAKLEVDPDDFPFLDQIRGHEDVQLRERIAADPGGFPWVEAG